MLSKFGSKVSSRFGSLDPLIIFIVLAVIVAIFFPISGRPAEWFSTATVVAVAVLFSLRRAVIHQGGTGWVNKLAVARNYFGVYVCAVSADWSGITAGGHGI